MNDTEQKPNLPFPEKRKYKRKISSWDSYFAKPGFYEVSESKTGCRWHINMPYGYFDGHDINRWLHKGSIKSYQKSDKVGLTFSVFHHAVLFWIQFMQPKFFDWLEQNASGWTINPDGKLQFPDDESEMLCKLMFS